MAGIAKETRSANAATPAAACVRMPAIAARGHVAHVGRSYRHEMSDAAVALAIKKVAAGYVHTRVTLDLSSKSTANGARLVATMAHVVASKRMRAVVGTVRDLLVVLQLGFVAATNAISSAEQNMTPWVGSRGLHPPLSPRSSTLPEL